MTFPFLRRSVKNKIPENVARGLERISHHSEVDIQEINIQNAVYEDSEVSPFEEEEKKWTFNERGCKKPRGKSRKKVRKLALEGNDDRCCAVKKPVLAIQTAAEESRLEAVMTKAVGSS